VLTVDSIPSVKNRSFEFPDGLMAWKKVERDGRQWRARDREDNPA
jgi:hypothetical protein